MVGVDTGFFIALMRGNEQARTLLHDLRREKLRAIVSVLCLGELLYILYREGRGNESAKIIRGIAGTMRIVNLDLEIVEEGAKIKDAKKIPYVYSLIGATAIVNGCKKLYTADTQHMTVLKDYGIDVVVIRE